MKRLKNFLFQIAIGLLIISCVSPSDRNNENSYGIVQKEDDKSMIIETLADSYLAGDFNKAREYFTADSKHYFNDLVFDVDGIIEGYNFHSILFDNIKHNDRKIYTGYFADGTVQTFHDFYWSAKSKISGNEYNYPCHCRWVWEDEKIVETICIVDPAAIFAEIALYQENN